MKSSSLPRFLALPLALVMAACPGDDGETDTTTTGTTDDTTTTTTSTETDDTTTTTDPTTTDATDTDPDTTDTTETTDPPGEACPTYCENAMANCTGDNAIYSGMDECLAACAAMPVGDPADVEGNTAWCRAYHAGDPATMDAATHCPHASASGGGVCGTPCEAYCSQIQTNCTEANMAYPTEEDCLATCAAFPQDGAFNATDGNSVQCRVYHASFPAAADAGVHCGHASSNGDSVCGSLCEGYCSQVSANCDQLFVDEMECMTQCEMYPTDGAWNAADGDSVQCRTYHASFPAVADAGTHCPHANIDGGGVCI